MLNPIYLSIKELAQKVKIEFHNQQLLPWKSYLLNQCEVFLSSHTSIDPSLENLISKRMKFHYQFAHFLCQNFELVKGSSTQKEIIQAFACSLNRPTPLVAMDLTSNKDNALVEIMITEVTKNYTNLLSGHCLEIGNSLYPIVEVLAQETIGKYYLFTNVKVKSIRTINLIVHNFSPGEKLASLIQPNELNCIFIPRIFHLFPNKKSALLDLHKLLKTESYLIFSESNKHINTKTLNPLEVTASFLPGFCESGGFLDKSDWILLLEDAGFEVVKQISYATFPDREFEEDGFVLISRKKK